MALPQLVWCCSPLSGSLHTVAAHASLDPTQNWHPCCDRSWMPNLRLPNPTGKLCQQHLQPSPRGQHATDMNPSGTQ
eukprot:3100393-Amphidinium_carterae.1